MKVNPWDGRVPKKLNKPPSDFNHDLVQRAEMLTLTQLDRHVLHVAILASTLGVSERTLRKIFNRTQNLSPCRHLRMLRLSWETSAIVSS
jgi:AraC-like DNA-binding protein